MPRLSFNLGGISAEQFRGKVVALYFGYTHCPDVCPATLANLSDMLGQVHSSDVRVLFVTVDPDRDTAPVLAQYAGAFSPQVVGLRGSANQLAALARAMRSCIPTRCFSSTGAAAPAWSPPTPAIPPKWPRT